MPYEFECDACGYTAGVYHLYKQHQLSHYRWKCVGCEFYPKTSTKYAAHMLEKHGVTKPFSCAKCERVYSTLGSLLAHDIMKHRPHAYVCDLCDFTAATKGYINKHKSESHGERKHVCDVCGFKSKTKHHLKIHKLIHGEPTFQCPLCPTKTRQPAGLRNHMMVHCTCKAGAACTVHPKSS